MANKKISQTSKTTIIGPERNTFEMIKEYYRRDTHPFSGLRYADDEWHLADYPVKTQLEKVSTLIQKRQPKKLL